MLLSLCFFPLSGRGGRVFFRGRTGCPEQGLCRVWKEARKTHQEILEMLYGNEINILLEFFQNVIKMETKWCPKWSQRFQEYWRTCTNHEMRPEALGAGTLVAFWRKNGAQGGPQGCPEGTKMCTKYITHGTLFQVCFRTSFFDGFLWISGGL